MYFISSLDSIIVAVPEQEVLDLLLLTLMVLTHFWPLAREHS